MMAPRSKDRYAGVIIELKAVESVDQLTSSAKEALAQIQSRNYAAELRSQGVSRVLMVGLCFCGKDVELEYVIERD